MRSPTLLLHQYEQGKSANPQSSSDGVVSLLPAIVEAMLSNEEVAKQKAAVWIQRLLVKLDLLAAVSTTNKRILKIAKTRIDSVMVAAGMSSKRAPLSSAAGLPSANPAEAAQGQTLAALESLTHPRPLHQQPQNC